METLTVYTVPGSPFGRAVQIALEEKGATYRVLGLTPGTLRSPEHLARHPFGRVPVLSHGDYRVYETQAILRYIDRILPGPALTPAGARAAARMDQLMNVNDWYLFRGVADVIAFQRVVGPRLMGLSPDEAAIAAAMPRAHTVCAQLARDLGADAYFGGAQPSLADILLAPQIDFLRITPEWEALSAGCGPLVTWIGRMNARPSLAATTWERVAARALAG